MSKEKSASEILKKRARRPPSALFRRLVKWSLVLTVFLMLMGATAMVGVYFYMVDDLPKITSLKDYHPSIITTVYSDDNRKIAEFYKERRIVVPLSKIPIQLQQAFIAAEDARFYKHQGIDFFSIVRAFIKNLEAGTIVQGGSTITQQVTKSFLLTPERSYKRKIKEAILAYRIDKTFSKEEILYLYLNQIYLGHGAYGVEAAAENYFGKSVSELNLAECAIMAGLPQAPSRYSPFRFPSGPSRGRFMCSTACWPKGLSTTPRCPKPSTSSWISNRAATGISKKYPSIPNISGGMSKKNMARMRFTPRG